MERMVDFMKIRTWIKYEESYLPPRCRKLRYKKEKYRKLRYRLIKNKLYLWLNFILFYLFKIHQEKKFSS